MLHEKVLVFCSIEGNIAAFAYTGFKGRHANMPLQSSSSSLPQPSPSCMCYCLIPVSIVFVDSCHIVTEACQKVL